MGEVVNGNKAKLDGSRVKKCSLSLKILLAHGENQAQLIAMAEAKNGNK